MLNSGPAPAGRRPAGTGRKRGQSLSAAAHLSRTPAGESDCPRLPWLPPGSPARESDCPRAPAADFPAFTGCKGMAPYHEANRWGEDHAILLSFGCGIRRQQLHGREPDRADRLHFADGGFVVAWARRYDAGRQRERDQGAALRRRGQQGRRRVPGQFRRPGSQFTPSVATLANGKLPRHLGDNDPAQDGSGNAIKAQLFGRSGAPIGGEFLVDDGGRQAACSTPMSRRSPTAGS